MLNIPGVRDGQLKLDADAVCKIYLGEINRGMMQRLLRLSRIEAAEKGYYGCFRSDGSGTTAIFTDYLNSACPAWKQKVGKHLGEVSGRYWRQGK